MSTNNNNPGVLSRFSLQGRVALVTGAGSGLGAHFAVVLAEAGAKVVCVARRLERVEAVAAAIRQGGGQATACVMDVTDGESIRQAYDVAEREFGTIDVLVNNAGLSDPAPFEEMTRTQWTSLLDANLSGPFFVAQEMARRRPT